MSHLHRKVYLEHFQRRPCAPEERDALHQGRERNGTKQCARRSLNIKLSSFQHHSTATVTDLSRESTTGLDDEEESTSDDDGLGFVFDRSDDINANAWEQLPYDSDDYDSDEDDNDIDECQIQNKDCTKKVRFHRCVVSKTIIVPRPSFQDYNLLYYSAHELQVNLQALIEEQKKLS